MNQPSGRNGHGSDGKGPKNQGPGKGGPGTGPGVKPPHIPGKTAGFWVLLLFLVFLVYQMIALDHTTIQELNYSTFREQVEKGNIANATKTLLIVTGQLKEKASLAVKDGTVREVDKFTTRLLSDRDDFAEWVQASNPDAVLTGEPQKTNWWVHFMTY